MAKKNVLLQMKIEEILTDIMVQTGADNVIVDSEKSENLATRLATIAEQISQLQAGEGGVSEDDVNRIVDEAISKLIADAPETYDTLKEIADYIATNESAVTALNQAIANKVDKEDGKGLSENDFTTALKTKLDNIAENATKVEKSEVNGNIKINGSDTTVYIHPDTAGNKHIPVGGADGQFVAYGGASGTGKWATPKTIVKTGASAPDDLANNELFFKLLN